MRTRPSLADQAMRPSLGMMIAVLALLSTTAAVAWPEPAVAWWYSPDNNWPNLIEQVCLGTLHAAAILPINK